MSARSIMQCVAVLLTLTVFCSLVMAQPGRRPGQPGQPRPGQPGQPVRPGQPMQPGDTEPSDAEAAAGCAACGGMVAVMVVSLVISIVSLVVWIFVVIWVAKDAKARGMDNGGLWVVLVLFLGLVGLIIYLVVRPAGELTTCDECGKKRLRELKRCPHCRAA